MFRFEEEEPPSDTEFSQYHGSAETERATCAPTRPAGGDGTGKKEAETNGESAEARRIARCGGTGGWTGDISLLRERPSFAARRKKAKTRPGNHSIKVPRGPSSRPRGSAPLDPRRGFTGNVGRKVFTRKDTIILTLTTFSQRGRRRYFMTRFALRYSLLPHSGQNLRSSRSSSWPQFPQKPPRSSSLWPQSGQNFASAS